MLPGSGHAGRFRVAVAHLAAAIAAVGCAASPGLTQREDGTLHTECRTPLSSCLKGVEKANDCGRYGYDVLYATERRTQTGSADLPASSARSEAIVRCRQPVPLLGHDPNPPTPEPPALTSAAGPPQPASDAAAPLPPEAGTVAGPPPPPPPPAAPPRCVPGTSIACASVAGCSGAQVCAPDGERFGPCECPPAQPRNPDTDRGPP